MQNFPLVSVIIPTYNRPDFLKLTIESILCQTYPKLEIIVVDDGSPGDHNQQLCKQFPEVNYIKIPNSGGPARPRNIGIGRAEGEYIALVDDDDIWLPEKIEKQVHILNTNPDFGLVHGPCEIIDENGTKTGKVMGRKGASCEKHGDVKLRMIGNWTIMMPTPLVRNTVFKQVGGFNEVMPHGGEDREFWSRCSFYTSFYYFDEITVLYRRHGSNNSLNPQLYIPLPLRLADIVSRQKKEGRINEKERKLLISYISRMQLNMVKINPFKVFLNMNKLDSLWFVKKNNIKTLAVKILRK